MLSVAVVSLEGTTLKPFITIVHHVVEYQVADNKDDEDSDGVESGFHGVITLGDAEDLVLVRLPKRVFDFLVELYLRQRGSIFTVYRMLMM